MPRSTKLTLDWSIHTKLAIKSLGQGIHEKDAPEDCNCNLCSSSENNGWRCPADPLNANVSIKNWSNPLALFSEPALKKTWDSKSNKVLSLSINFSGDQPTDMSMIIRQLPQYSSWTGILELAIHPDMSHNEKPVLYTKHVQEIKALVQQINLSLPEVHQIRCQVIASHFGFSPLKIAAGLIDLKNKNWNLAHVYEDDKRMINDIHKKSSFFERLEVVYWNEFADDQEIYKDV